MGPGPWSDSLEIVSGAGAPDTPLGPKVTARSPTVILVEWNEPSFNGAMVTEYRLQFAVVRKCLSPTYLASEVLSRSTSTSSTSSLMEEDDDFDDDQEELEEDEDFEPEESLDSEAEAEASARRKVVKRKRKSFRSNDEADENSDSYDEAERPRRLVKVKQPPLRSEDEVFANQAPDVEPQEESDELPKELLFSNIYSGPNRTFEAR